MIEAETRESPMKSPLNLLVAAIGLGLGLQATPTTAEPVKSGTGFVINDQGHLITNNHVVSYDFKTNDGKRYVGVCSRLDVKGGAYEGIADIVGRDKANDLAVLKLRNFTGAGKSSQTKNKDERKSESGKKGKWRSLGNELAAGGAGESNSPIESGAGSSGNVAGGNFASLSADALRPGQPVIAVGYPFSFRLSAQPKIVTGVLSSTAGPQHNASVMQHTAPVNPGNSGGPLFNSSGQVIGVNVAIMNPSISQNISFSIKLGVTKEFLESLGVPYSVSERGAELRNEELMENASRYTVLILCHL